MLVSAHDGAINHGVFVVRIGRQRFENPLPDATLRPPRVTGMHLFPITEPLWQVSPRDARAIAVENRFNEPPIILGNANMALTWKQLLRIPRAMRLATILTAGAA